MNPDQARSMAVKVVRKHVFPAGARSIIDCDCEEGEWCQWHHELIDAIQVQLLAASKPPAGSIIDDTGAVRKVLGTLPVTADGCVVGVGATIYRRAPEEWGKDHMIHASVSAYEPDFDADMKPIPVPDYYSTLEAARGAKP